jgi:hypothetical protein
VDIYLFLLRESKGQTEFTVPYESLAESLGIPASDRPVYQAQLARVLRKMDRRYGLIRYLPQAYRGDIRVRLLLPMEDAFGIPAGYWEYGWSGALSLPGKLAYLVNRLRSERSPARPRWSASLATLSRDHGLTVLAMSKGTTALRRANLVEVDYDDLPMEPEGELRPNIFTPLPLYDRRALPGAWARLEALHGKDVSDRARRCAVLVYKDDDVETVERFIALEKAYGREKVEKAYKIIAAKAPHNPKRGAGYFINTVKRMD